MNAPYHPDSAKAHDLLHNATPAQWQRLRQCAEPIETCRCRMWLWAIKHPGRVIQLFNEMEAAA